MKKISTLFLAGMLIGIFCVAFAACNGSGEPGQTRTPEEPEQSDELTDDIYYVAGYDAQTLEYQGDGTFKCGIYLFISENRKDTVGVYNFVKLTSDRGDYYRPGELLDGLFEFSEDIEPVTMCGYVLFPEEHRYSFKVKINSWRKVTENDERPDGLICNGLIMVSYIRPNKSAIIIESLSKVE